MLLTSLFFKVISNQWDGVLGRTNVIVTSEPVTPGDLSVQLVGGLGLSVNSSPSHPSIVTATVNAHNTLYNHGQVSIGSTNAIFNAINSTNFVLFLIVSALILLGSICQCLDPV